MKLHIVPASTGLQWVKLGVQTFWRQPLALTALLFLSMAAISLLGIFPVVGAILALMLMPTVFLIMMLGAAEASQQRNVHPSLALAPFRAGKKQVQSLLILGVFYSICTLLISLLTSVFDDGTLAKLSMGHETMTPELAQELIQTPGFQTALWTSFALYNLLAMVMWHAPALVHWHGVSPIKALFFSVIACLRNFRAFFVYGLGWMGLALGAGVVLSLLTVLLTAILGPAAGMAASILTIIFGMALISMFLASAVFTFRDCFSPPDNEHVLHVNEVTYDYK